MPFVRVSDIRIHYEVSGNGEPLLFIPGWGTEITTMAAVIEKFSSHFRIIAIDNRGTGRSGKPDAPYSIEQMADDAVAVLDALGVQHAHVLGLSMGGMIAQMFAAKYPDRVNRLVLVVAFTRITFLVRTMMNLMRILPGSKKRMEEGMTLILGQNYPPTPESFRRQGEAVAAFDARPILGRIRAPACVINAARDQFVPRKISRELARGITGARCILLDGDHSIVRTEPDLVVGLAVEFLNGMDCTNKQSAE